MAEVMTGEATPGAARRLPRRPARQGRVGRGAARHRRRHARARAPHRGARARPSTSSAPAATACTRSTSRRWPRSSSPPPGCAWSSTATARRRRARGRPTCSRRSACRSTLTPGAGRRGGRGRPASPSASPTPSTPRCATRRSTRRDLGVGTAFNALGPLTNPAQPTYAAVGVADARIAPLIAGVFAGRGRAGSRLPRRRRPRRAHPRHDVHRVVGARRRGHPS